MTYHDNDPGHTTAHNDHVNQISGLQTSLANKSDVGHAHGQASVTNLVTDLADLDSRINALEVTANRGVLVLGAEDAVPDGTPSGTVILRTA